MNEQCGYNEVKNGELTSIDSARGLRVLSQPTSSTNNREQIAYATKTAPTMGAAMS